jgi:WD40 repeat protein
MKKLNDMFKEIEIGRLASQSPSTSTAPKPRTFQSTPHQCGRLLALAALVCALLAGSDGRAAIIANPAEPPVVFSVQPEEEGKLVYLRIPPETGSSPPSQLLGFRIRAVNNGGGQVRLTKIRAVFPGHPALTQDFNRDVLFSSGQTRTLYVTPEESIRLPDPPPSLARIELHFEGFLNPATIQRSLAPCVSPAPGGFYLFPGNGSDLGPDQYFSNKPRHTGGGQYFGYDLVVHGWNPGANGFDAVKPGGDSGKNEDRLGWNIPIYSMGDGTVLRASTGWEDNPAPGKRSIQRMGEHLAGGITDVKVARLGADRAASAVRTAAGNLKVIVWDTENNGREIIRRGSAEGEPVQEIAAGALSASRLVTAIRTTTGHLRVIVWSVSSDGETVTRLGEHDAAPVKELSLIKISSSRFATAVRTQEDALRLMVWEVTNQGATVSLLSHAFAGAISSISTVALGSSRLVTSFRSNQGKLKLIVWDLLDGGATIQRRGEATAGPITKVVSATTSGSHVVTAMRTAIGKLKVIRWEVSQDGQKVTQDLETDAGHIQDLAMAATFDQSVMTAVVTHQGTFKNILWLPKPTEATFTRRGEREAGMTDRLDVDETDTGLIFSGVRTAGGNLKIITWWIGHGGGNSLVILHGNCRVLYAHFKDGTVDPKVAYPGAPVAAGQFLGRMGNSGSSSGPHLHIHASRVSSFLTVQEAIDLEAQGALPIIAYRPIPFHGARTMRLNAIQPGGEANPANTFSAMQGHGVYFERFGIRPTWIAPIESALTSTIRGQDLVLDWRSDVYRLQHKKTLEAAWEDHPRGKAGPVSIPMQEPAMFYRLKRDEAKLEHFGLSSR